MRRARIVVRGDVRPQGSKTAVVRGGRARVIEGKGPGRVAFHAWRKLVRETADAELDSDRFPIEKGVPVAVRLLFETARPAYHHRGNDPDRELRPDAPYWNPTQKPGDADKLARAVLDGLTGAAFVNDSQVADLHVAKFYGDCPGVVVYVVELNPSGYVPFAGVPLELLTVEDLDRAFRTQPTPTADLELG